MTVQLTTKGSRLLGSIHRLLDDWYAFHMKGDLEQLLFQSGREVELMDAYEARGYETGSLARALSFLERAYKDISSRTYEMIASGVAPDQAPADGSGGGGRHAAGVLGRLPFLRPTGRVCSRQGLLGAGT